MRIRFKPKPTHLPGWPQYEPLFKPPMSDKHKRRLANRKRRKEHRYHAPYKVKHYVLRSVKDGREYLAYYEKRKKLKLVRFDQELEFLKYCGARDAKRALQKRGFSYSWPQVKSEKCSSQRSSPKLTMPVREPAAYGTPRAVANDPETLNGGWTTEPAPGLPTPGFNREGLALPLGNRNPPP